MPSRQIVHSLVAHDAQTHFYGSLVAGLIFALIAVLGLFGLVRTLHRRSRRDRIAATVSLFAPCLIASSYVVNAFSPLKPHHLSFALVPLHGIGSILFMSGFAAALVGIGLMPIGEAGKWLPDKKEADNSKEIEAGVWPPAPKI